MSEKTYKLILKIGVLLAFVSFIFVFSHFYFPYVTTKQIFFNILVEILIVFWLAMIIKYPHTRPQKSWITFGMIAFFLVLLISCFTGVDFNLSFWGDLERMLGWFDIIHFLLYYLIVITVFKEWKDWKILFNVSLIFAVWITLQGIFLNDPTSSIGQNAYVAGLMIFNFYFAIFLFLKTKDFNERIWYCVALFFVLWGFVNSDVSGAQVGLLASIMMAGFLIFLIAKNKKAKIITISCVLLIAVTGGTLYALKDNAVFDDTKIGKMLRDLSLENNNLNTRLLSWEAAIKDFPNHWLIGTGYGNYAIVFDKNFSPDFIKYATIEENFDRAHNNLIDIATTSGILGLLSYLSFFVATVYYLISGYKKKKIDVVQFVVIMSLLSGYFVHNLAVFDALVNYVVLMCTLGYVYCISTDVEEKIKPVKVEKAALKEVLVFILVGLPSLFIMYYYNLRAATMMTYMIDGLMSWTAGNYEESFESYKTAFSFDTPVDRDARVSYIDLIGQDSSKIADLTPEKQKEMILFAVELVDKNLAYNQKDYFMNMEKGLIYMVLAEFTTNTDTNNPNQTEDTMQYYQTALDSINTAIENGGARILPRIIKGNILVSMGEKMEVVYTYLEAIETNPNYPKISCYLALAQFEAKDAGIYTSEEEIRALEGSYSNAATCIKEGNMEETTFWENYDGIAAYLIEQEDWTTLVNLSEPYIQNHLDDYDLWYNLALGYWGKGEENKARESADVLIQTFPDKAEEAKESLAGYGLVL